MLLLAFSAPSGVADDSVEQEAARADHAGTEVLADLYSSTLEGPLKRWSWQTPLLVTVSTTNE